MPLPRRPVKSLLSAAMAVPGLDVAVLRGMASLLERGRGLLYRRPDRLVTAYRLVLHLYHRLELERQQGNTSPAGLAWERLDAALHEVIHEWLESGEDVEEVRRINQALAILDADERVEVSKGFPFRGYLELTSVCNLRCRMCTQAGGITPVYLELEHLDRLEPAFRYLRHISLVGLGEAFVHRDFREFLTRIRARNVAVRVISNGILLDEDLARFVIGQGLEDLWISLDATDSQTYLEIRGMDRFDRILDNIRRLNSLKAEMGKDRPVINLNFVIMRRNVEQIADFIRLASDLGAPAVHACYMIAFIEEMREESVFYDKALANRCLREARGVAKELGVAFHGPDLFREPFDEEGPHEDDGEWGYLKCREPWEFAYFNCEGKVVPCCTEQARLADLREMSFPEIWNGNAYRAYRRSLTTDHPSPFCRECMLVGLRDINRPECHFRMWLGESVE
ncbi:radical SAM protein [bacterium]|nr:radical SAM protein [bacterium]